MTMSPAGLGTKNDWAGEDQQQFTWLTKIFGQSEIKCVCVCVCVCVGEGQLVSECRLESTPIEGEWPVASGPSSRWRERHTSKHTQNKFLGHGSRRDSKPRIILLARANSNLADRPTDRPSVIQIGMVSFTSQSLQKDPATSVHRRPDEPWSQFGHGGKEKNPFACRESNSGCQALTTSQFSNGERWVP
jgi:hypothetical protein